MLKASTGNPEFRKSIWTLVEQKLYYMLEHPKRRSPKGLALTGNQQATCESRESSTTKRKASTPLEW